MKDSDEASSLGIRSRWVGLRNALVSVQIAISIVLLVGAGLLVRSLLNAESADLGFKHEGLAVLDVDLGEAHHQSGERAALLRELKERMEAIPGAQSVSLGTRLPVTPQGGSSTLEIEDYQGTAEVIYALVDEDYFHTLAIPLLHGRALSRADRSAPERIAVVNEAFARRYWGTADGVGRRYRHQGRPDSWTRVVGVVGDTKVRAPHEASTPMYYRLLATDFDARLLVVARTSGEANALVPMMRQVLRSLDPNVPLYRSRTVDDHVADALSLHRTAATTLALLASLAALLANMGLYAVVSFSVSRRTGEIGVRMAMGANGRQVVTAVMKETLLVSGAGVMAGLGLSVIAMPVLQSILIDVEATDPTTFAGVAILMTVVAAIASFLPARRAAQTDPMKALRAD